MSKPEQAPEPSIEEILASIRRIIADDAPTVELASASALNDQPPQAYGRRPKLSDSLAQRPAEDEVLELTEDFMLADEAGDMALQEPSEPQEVGGAEQYEEQGESSSYSDPYDESFARRGMRAVATASATQDESGGEPAGMFSAVMAEVQRFAGGSQMNAAAERAPSPESNWGQPDVDALTPQPSSGTASRPVWSARRKEMDSERSPAETTLPRQAIAEPSPARRSDATGRDDWNRGVQMPVPDAGPAIPFPAEDGFEPHPKAAARQPAPEAPAGMRRDEVAPAQTDIGGGAVAAPAVVHDKAEELAGKAISDFTNDRLSAPPVVADILKADKPLMDAITSSLVSALSRAPEEAEEFEEAPHPEDFADDIFDAAQPSAEAETAGAPAKVERPATSVVANLQDGFNAQRPVVVVKAVEPTVVDQEIPELPREDMDDIVMDTEAMSTDRPVHRPIGIAEPLVPNVPVASSQVAPRPAVGFAAAREQVSAAQRLPSVTAANSLEETIKEMLRPLLIQWLDENMPRIVNEALREEMAMKGLLPKARESRR